ncbi:quinol dehydrogenase ferredoxin subunit NapH [Denitratisoma sp. DHT3]|uniref:quinol dehydrogenase ferredoxin subunit NapH n=1 Tax=Denitratisoma sp. DHT3 TaxID=1981880 RepID=UPI0011983DAB|nr:quinol dehydrogenase ferredoxin subunit NapH [Denitratisoma sp. DHT3]QDX82386.1 quinol dehydrogenase ferredoxin subunit NapH [Denitratisoma sp. DHT3]
MNTVPATALSSPRSWWRARRWLLLRRLSQAGVLSLFLAGPWLGWWLVKGNLNFSLTLGTLPLADPYVLLQSLLSGHAPERLALIGAAIVLVFYLLVGGRAYCSWVCPLNPVTDAAHWLRRRLGIKGGAQLGRQVRYWILGMTLLLAIATGSLAWELINPVSMLHRGLIFGMGAAWLVVLAVFLFDLFVADRGWCGHLCPVGAFYSLPGRFSLLRVNASRRGDCDDCMDCYAVCPEPRVLRAPLKDMRTAPLILAPSCTNCGRCIDVCAKDVFSFGSRFHNSHASSAAGRPSIAPDDQNPS